MAKILHFSWTLSYKHFPIYSLNVQDLFFNLKLKISGYHKIGLKNRCIEYGIWLNDLQKCTTFFYWLTPDSLTISKYKMILIMYKGHWIHVMMIHIFLITRSLFVANLMFNYYMNMLGWAEYQLFCWTLKNALKATSGASRTLCTLIAHTCRHVEFDASTIHILPAWFSRLTIYCALMLIIEFYDYLRPSK